jgi:transposase
MASMLDLLALSSAARYPTIEEANMKRAHDRATAVAQLVEGMRRRQPWHEAVRASGYRVGRSAAYRLLQRRRLEGETVLRDGRQGHPSKLREPVCAWLEEYFHSHPEQSARQVQAAVIEHLGVRISISHLNRVRAAWGLSRRMHPAAEDTSPC